MAGPDFIVVMGVSGSGKSEIASRLAAALGGAYLEADRLHSAANVAKMSEGIALTDQDRWPWLAAVCEVAQAEAVRPVVIACSALKRRYRDFLRERLGGLRVVFLDGPRELIAERMRARTNHFAGVALLDSQLATLEPPGPDEAPVTLALALSPERIAAEAAARLRGEAVLPG